MYKIDELYNLSKDKVIEYDKHLRQLRQSAKEKNDRNEYALLSRTIEFTSRIIKHKKFDDELSMKNKRQPNDPDTTTTSGGAV